MGRSDLGNYGALRKISSGGEKPAEIAWPTLTSVKNPEEGSGGKGEPSLPASDFFRVTEKSISETDVKDSA